MSYLPEALRDGTIFYEPSHEGREVEIAERVARWRDAVRRNEDEG